ncbi:MAG TPA: carboxypeptidase-like regulatory domain-containing protein, partial [Chitinophagales bacterium]|nr:carboxypeptidase-like regulatory domain-containing protein [Chitinophagales bacterium]
MLKPLLLTLGICFTAILLNAQTGAVTGKVTDQKTGEALMGVVVMVDSTSNGAVTDADGLYRIEDVKYGTVKLVFKFISYATKQATVNVNAPEVRLDMPMATEEKKLN